MYPMKTKETSVKNDELEKKQFEEDVFEEEEIEDLEFFIKKKKAQTIVLKKLFSKLNTDENNTLNK